MPSGSLSSWALTKSHKADPPPPMSPYQHGPVVYTVTQLNKPPGMVLSPPCPSLAQPVNPWYP